MDKRMDGIKIIKEMLGIQGVNIKDLKVFRKTFEMQIVVEQETQERVCKECGKRLTGIHDWQVKRIEAPPLGIFTKVEIELAYARGYCKKCDKICSPKISWLHPEVSSMTCGFAEIAGRVMEEASCEATGRLLRTNPRKLWNLDQYRMEVMLQRMKLPENIDLKELSADEIHFKTIHRKLEKNKIIKDFEVMFVTNLVSYNDSKVIFNSMGRGAESLQNCLAGLSKEEKGKIKRVCVDIHEPYMSAIRRDLPNARICVDRFHLVQQMNWCFDEVRKAELNYAKERADQFTETMLLPSRRFALIEKKKDLTKGEIKMIDKLRQMNQNIHTGMLVVEYFHKLLDKHDLESFRTSLKNWYLLVRQSALKPFLKFSKTIRRYRCYIEEYITSGLPSAVSEGLNNKIKTLKRMAYGYANPFSFRLKILQRCGYLNHYHINTDDLLYNVPYHR